MTSAAVHQPRVLTAEDLAGLPDDGRRYELVNGELLVMAPAGFHHGDVAGEVLFAVKAFVKAGNLGKVLTAETGFRLSRGPDTVRAPDVAFVRADRVPPSSERAGFVELAPDLVVEVVSPGDRAAEVTAKALQWLDAGVRLVWVVYPGSASVVAHTPDGVARVVRGDGVLDGGDVLPGFALPLCDLFTDD